MVDSSPDDQVVRTLEALADRAPCALRWYRKRPEGPGPSRNLGVERARARYVAFMDSDCEADAGWLEAGLHAIEPEGVGLVQGRTLPDPRGRPGILTWHLSVEHENHVYETANIFYRREALEAAGGFPSDLSPHDPSPMGGEDVELAWRVKRLGWSSAFSADAVVFHEVVPISPLRWLASKRLYVWPRIVRNVPEVRSAMVLRYFYDVPQALLVLGLVGVAMAPITAWSLLAFLPYVLYRGSGTTASLGSFLRPLRVLVYLPRDLAALGLLVWGSVRFRSLLL